MPVNIQLSKISIASAISRNREFTRIQLRAELKKQTQFCAAAEIEGTKPISV
jgi:hypothetical protein